MVRTTRRKAQSRRAFVPLAPLLTLLTACSGSGDDNSVPVPDAGPADATVAKDGAASDAGKGSTDAGDAGAGDAGDAGAVGLSKINHFVVIYMENHSFDNLYGEFPGAEGLSATEAGAPNVVQQAPDGSVYPTLPISASETVLTPALADASLPNAPFPIEDFVQSDQLTVDLPHIFYTEQYQINDGGMNQFVYFSTAQGLSMGHWHTMHLPVPVVAQQFTVCDHFFHAAFGGSFLNHFWLIAARTPEWFNAPAPDAGGPSVDDPTAVFNNAPVAGEGQLTSDGYVVNTSYSVNTPHPPGTAPGILVPSQTFDTIGDRLIDANVNWAWYAGGWNDILSWLGADATGPQPAGDFQYHHQPFRLLLQVCRRDRAEGAALEGRDGLHRGGKRRDAPRGVLREAGRPQQRAPGLHGRPRRRAAPSLARRSRSERPELERHGDHHHL